MDYMTRLPLEILEMIIQHLCGADLINCCYVSPKWQQAFDNEHLWKILCKKYHWDSIDRADMDIPNTWRNRFWINSNWRKANFYIRQVHIPVLRNAGVAGNFLYSVRKGKMYIYNLISQFPTICYKFRTYQIDNYHLPINVEAWNKYLLVTSGRALLILKADLHNSKCHVHKRIYFYQTHSKTTINELVTEVPSFLSISRDDHEYQTRRTNTNFTYEGRIHAVVNENKSAVFQGRYIFVSVIDPWAWIYIILCDDITPTTPKSLNIIDNHLSLMIRKEGFFIARRYSFADSKRCLSVVCAEYSNEGSCSDLSMNCEYVLLTEIINTLNNYDKRVDLQIWDKTGKKLMNIRYTINIVKFNCCLVKDMLVYPKTKSELIVYKPKTMSKITDIIVDQNFLALQNAPGNTLIITYIDRFSAYDLLNGIRLYSVYLGMGIDHGIPSSLVYVGASSRICSRNDNGPCTYFIVNFRRRVDIGD